MSLSRTIRLQGADGTIAAGYRRLARGFGTRNFGPVMGLIGPLMIPFQITGPPLAGFIFDSRGSYDLALWIFLVSTAAAALALALLRLPSETESGASHADPGADGAVRSTHALTQDA